jgi:hypothetical protein
MVDVFKGYNHNLRIGDGEFFDMKNMTSDYYPVASPRKERGVYASATNPNGMISKDNLCYVDGTKFVINGYPVDMGLSDEPKQLISMGAYVIIMPDKKWINTLNTTQFGNIEAIWKSTGDVTFTLCTITGDAYDGAAASATEPKEPKNMQMWIDISSTPHVLKQYSETSAAWISIATTYIKISALGIGKVFEQYDGVTISGVKASGLQALNSTTVIWDKGDDYIVVVGILDEVTTQTVAEGVITVGRTMPKLDYLTESDNRLWGCKYGMADNGQVVNEIYACKLGDFKNWNCFMGISTDSYVAGVGSDGPFTGAVTHLGYPLFFKENIMHKVYGKYPANFQIQDTACRGVQKDCDRSMAIVNETLLYKARSGIMAYDGSLPTEVSYALGTESYSNAVGGAHGNKYYVSMEDRLGQPNLFVYDTAKGMWHKEDNLRVSAFCSCRGEMYAIDADTKKILTMLGAEEGNGNKLQWMVETGEIGISSPDMKYISRLTVRMLLNIGSEVRIYGKYDFSDEWEHLFVTKGTSLRSFSVPIRPKRCDHMKLRIEGEGMAKIYSITKTIEQGSDIS